MEYFKIYIFVIQKSFLCSLGEISLDYNLYVDQKCGICLNFFKSNAVFEISISKGAKWTYSLLLIDNCKKSKFFAVCADETTDVSVKEQLSISVRYVDGENYEILEDFLGFVEQGQEVDAEHIAD